MENLGCYESRCQGTKPRPGDSGLSILLSQVLSLSLLLFDLYLASHMHGNHNGVVLQ